MLLKDSGLTASALHWDLEYLADHMGRGHNTVFTSATDQFRYWSEDKVKNVPGFRPPTKSQRMEFAEFARFANIKICYV